MCTYWRPFWRNWPCASAQPQHQCCEPRGNLLFHPRKLYNICIFIVTKYCANRILFKSRSFIPKFSAPSFLAISKPFFTWAPAYARTWQSGLVAAPFMYLLYQCNIRNPIILSWVFSWISSWGTDLGWANRLQVTHSTLTPVCFCSCRAKSEISSRFLLDSSSVQPSGAMSLQHRILLVLLLPESTTCFKQYQ